MVNFFGQFFLVAIHDRFFCSWFYCDSPWGVTVWMKSLAKLTYRLFDNCHFKCTMDGNYGNCFLNQKRGKKNHKKQCETSPHAIIFIFAVFNARFSTLWFVFPWNEYWMHRCAQFASIFIFMTECQHMEILNMYVCETLLKNSAISSFVGGKHRVERMVSH